MKKIPLLILLFITTIYNPYALADNCTTAGVTTGKTCWQGIGGNVNMHTSYATHCTSSSAGCVFINCISDCTCNSPGYVCPSGGSTTDCSSVTCNPIWGDIDNTTHIQTGKAQTPDTKNGCKCKDKPFGLMGSTIYRCIAGYYDTVTGITISGSKPKCEKCPSIGNNNVAGKSNTGFTEDTQNKGITSCYIPYNTEITDNTGTYIFYGTRMQELWGGGCNWTE